MRILNDIHLGAIRAAGTTPQSQWNLRVFLQTQFQNLLPIHSHVLLLGDLFDTNTVPLVDLLQAHQTLTTWLTANPNYKLYNVRGNHDASKTSNVLSSFDFLGKLLSRFSNYVHITTPTLFSFGYVVPHLANQDLFNLALEQAPKDVQRLFVHCNYDNNFAAQSDQSLNLSAKQVADCSFAEIIFGHEHRGKTDNKVFIPGNQIASSVADWLSPQDKRYLEIDGNGNLVFKTCAFRSENFLELVWDEPIPAKAEAYNFVRFIGTAEADEASKALDVVNKFRKMSASFVVSNAIAVKTLETDVVDFERALVDVQGFNVVEALRELLSAEEFAVIEPFTKAK